MTAANPRKFRFAIQIFRADSAAQWRDLARTAEDLGYDTLAIPDHFVNQEWSPVPALAAAADATSTLRLAATVFNIDYRHPVVLAKDTATLDLISDGRLEVGLGAGWQRADYVRSGIRFDAPATRIERLEESIQIIKGLWSDGPFRFLGRHYAIDGLESFPKPFQRPRPPILVGGGGRRVLSVAAREADIVGLNANLRQGAISPTVAASVTGSATDRKIQWIREAAGLRFHALELNVLVSTAAVTQRRKEKLESIASVFGWTLTEAAEVPHALVGTVDQISDDLEARRERYGISYVTVQGVEALHALAPVVSRLAGT